MVPLSHAFLRNVSVIFSSNILKQIKNIWLSEILCCQVSCYEMCGYHPSPPVYPDVQFRLILIFNFPTQASNVSKVLSLVSNAKIGLNEWTFWNILFINLLLEILNNHLENICAVVQKLSDFLPFRCISIGKLLIHLYFEWRVLMVASCLTILLILKQKLKNKFCTSCWQWGKTIELFI